MASLNLHCGFGAHGEPFDVAAAICGLDAAVICIQEVWLPTAAGTAIGEAWPDHVADAAAKLGAVVHRAAMCTRPSVARLGVPSETGPGELSIAVLTNLPVTGYEVLQLGLAPGDNVPRVAQVIGLQVDGTALRLVNTHLTHMLTGPLQLRRLQRCLRFDAAQSGPDHTIIAGDLNMPRALAARAAGYSPAVRGPTWPADRPVMQLDHLLASRGIDRLDGVVLPPAGSDHLPIRARFRLHR